MRTSATHSERERFVADLVRHAPAADSVIAGRLMRYAGAYHRLAGLDGELNFKEHRKLERIHGKIRKLCEQIRCNPVFFGSSVCVSTPYGLTIPVPKIGGI